MLRFAEFTRTQIERRSATDNTRRCFLEFVSMRAVSLFSLSFSCLSSGGSKHFNQRVFSYCPKFKKNVAKLEQKQVLE